METNREFVDRMSKARELNGTSVRLNPIERAKLYPKSKAKAIKAKCFDCVGQGYDPNWQKEVRECACIDCPLHNVRPFQKRL